jgi:hypothetical protein
METSPMWCDEGSSYCHTCDTVFRLLLWHILYATLRKAMGAEHQLPRGVSKRQRNSIDRGRTNRKRRTKDEGSSKKTFAGSVFPFKMFGNFAIHVGLMRIRLVIQKLPSKLSTYTHTLHLRLHFLFACNIPVCSPTIMITINSI